METSKRLDTLRDLMIELAEANLKFMHATDGWLDSLEARITKLEKEEDNGGYNCDAVFMQSVHRRFDDLETGIDQLLEKGGGAMMDDLDKLREQTIALTDVAGKRFDLLDARLKLLEESVLAILKKLEAISNGNTKSGEGEL